MVIPTETRFNVIWNKSPKFFFSTKQWKLHSTELDFINLRTSHAPDNWYPYAKVPFGNRRGSVVDPKTIRLDATIIIFALLNARCARYMHSANKIMAYTQPQFSLFRPTKATLMAQLYFEWLRGGHCWRENTKIYIIMCGNRLKGRTLDNASILRGLSWLIVYKHI